jgi:purine-binding chemotaxis protein CheW
MFTFPLNINTNNQYILFTLDNQNYFLDLKHVKEFTSIKRLNITTLPYTKDYIKGIINLKGDFLIVIDLKRFLNNETSQLAEGSKLIVVLGKNFNIALLVDDIKNIKNLTNNQIRNPEYTGSSEYISNEFVEDGQLYNILNFDKFINDDKLYINI